jgi:hypothetical protein
MRSVVAQLSTFSFVFLCVAASGIETIFFPTIVALMLDLIGVRTEAPISNFVGWSLLISAAVGLVFPITALMSVRGDFDPVANDQNHGAALTDGAASFDWIAPHRRL